MFHKDPIINLNSFYTRTLLELITLNTYSRLQKIVHSHPANKENQQGRKCNMYRPFKSFAVVNIISTKLAVIAQQFPKTLESSSPKQKKKKKTGEKRNFHSFISSRSLISKEDIGGSILQLLLEMKLKKLIYLGLYNAIAHHFPNYSQQSGPEKKELHTKIC